MFAHDVKVASSDGAVGLFREDGDHSVLRVPVGMEGMDASEALALLYKTFVVFRRTRRSQQRLAALDGVERQPKHGLGQEGDNVAFCDLLGLDELFDRANPRYLLSLCERRVRQSRDVYQRIDRQLHLAIFDSDGAPYLERIHGSRREVRYGSGEIIGLYCFVALDFYEQFLHVKHESAWGSFAEEGKSLADEFRRRYLTTDASLYVDSKQPVDQSLQIKRTLENLRHLLRMIDSNTSFRDFTYHSLYEVLDRYLNKGLDNPGQKGQIWGVRDFWAVWESVCLYHATLVSGVRNFLTCDFEHLPPGLSNQCLENSWLNERASLFARNEISRRPDLVVNMESLTKVIDFKYYSTFHNIRTDGSKEGLLGKEERDFLNIEIYGLLMQNHLLVTSVPGRRDVEMEFWLPGAKASSTPFNRKPNWNPPLSVVTLETKKLVKEYSALYGG